MDDEKNCSVEIIQVAHINAKNSAYPKKERSLIIHTLSSGVLPHRAALPKARWYTYRPGSRVGEWLKHHVPPSIVISQMKK